MIKPEPLMSYAAKMPGKKGYCADKRLHKQGAETLKAATWVMTGL